jgi:outer membrane murein-binding lipoprotein Lpp
MRLVLPAVAIALLSGCANFDNEKFQQVMQSAYAMNQAQNAWQAPLNAQNYAAMQAQQARIDREWDWDQFYGPNNQLVWACRGVQSGQFADAAYCNYLMKVDFRWPDKYL